MISFSITKEPLNRMDRIKLRLLRLLLPKQIRVEEVSVYPEQPNPPTDNLPEPGEVIEPEKPKVVKGYKHDPS